MRGLVIVAVVILLPLLAPAILPEPVIVPGINATSTNHFDYSLTIMMENHNLTDITAFSAPYENSLANSWAESANMRYESICCSLPNYLAITSGSTQGISDDGSPSVHPLEVTNIVDRLEGARLTWKGYMEGMQDANVCNGGGSVDGGNNYLVHHNPFAYYTDITNNTARCTKVIQAGGSGATGCNATTPSGLVSNLLSDLGSTSSASNFMWLGPNNYDNSHDCGVGAGNDYLQAIVPAILNSTVFRTQRAVLFITYHEGHDVCCADHIYTVFAGPQAKTGYSSGGTTYNHYSWLRTIEDNWGLATLTSNDAGAINMNEFLVSSGQDFRLSANPAYVSVPTETWGSSSITVSGQGGFAGNVGLTVSSPGLLCNLNPTSVTLPLANSSSLTCAGTRIGLFNATVTGSYSAKSRSVTVVYSVGGSWNPNVGCSPVQVRISDLTNNMTGLASYGSSPFSPGIVAPPPYNNSNADHVRRWLAPGVLSPPHGWVSPGPPCVIRNKAGAIVASFVEIDGVAAEKPVYDVGDCSKWFDWINGNKSQPVGHWCDNTFNIFDPSVFAAAGYNYTSGCVGTTPDRSCYGKMHLEFDHDWMAAGYCGRATSFCNNSTFAGRVNWTTLFDFQGFVFWDPEHVTAAWHSFSGWELHPLTAWRIHVPMVKLDPSPRSVGPLNSNVVGTSKITIISVGGFSGSVMISTSTGPYSASCPSPISLSSGANKTITCSFSSAQTGTYSVEVAAYNGTSVLIGSAALTVTVVDFTLSTSDTSAMVVARARSNSTVTVAPLNGFTGTVALHLAANATGLTCTLSLTGITGGSGTSTLSCTGSVAGNYLATVTGTSGTLSHSATVTYHVQDFTISANPASVTVNSGAAGTSTTSVAPVNGFIGTVTLAASTDSTNLSCTLTSTSITGGLGPSTLSCAGSVAGNYLATVTGTSSTLSHSANVIFHVQNFTVTAGPTSVTVNSGVAGTSTITVAPVNEFADTVTLAATTNSTNLYCTLTSTSIVGGSGISALSCTGSIAGNYLATVTGTSGTLSHVVAVTYHVSDFSISLNPSSLTIVQGQTQNVTAMLASLNGYSGSINVTSQSSPSGLPINPSSTTATLSSGNTRSINVTFSPTSTTVAQTYTVNITATSGSLSRSGIVLVAVQQPFRFSLSASRNITLGQGGGGNNTISIALVSGSSRPVNLACNGPPTNASCIFNPLLGSPPFTSSLNISTMMSTPIGNFTITVTGTGGGISRTVSFFLTVRNATGVIGGTVLPVEKFTLLKPYVGPFFGILSGLVAATLLLRGIRRATAVSKSSRTPST